MHAPKQENHIITDIMDDLRPRGEGSNLWATFCMVRAISNIR
jgi:hypothetical protein